jgi:hypothetical protein
MTVVQWIGLVGLVFFTVVLIWSLVQWHNSPPDK